MLSGTLSFLGSSDPKRDASIIYYNFSVGLPFNVFHLRISRDYLPASVPFAL